QCGDCLAAVNPEADSKDGFLGGWTLTIESVADDKDDAATFRRFDFANLQDTSDSTLDEPETSIDSVFADLDRLAWFG
ncbi:MAG: hypothetical protein AAF497_19400, partial [Planctomycetota bacterium]